MLTDKANILAKNAKRARVVRPNNNFGEGRIRPAKDDGKSADTGGTAGKAANG